MRIVVGLGGNALLRRGDRADLAVERRRVRETVAQLAPLAAVHDLVITHGNGPQVGLLALQSETGGTPMPLDVLDAVSEGLIGYLLEQELRSALSARHVAVVLTQVEVDAADAAFREPTKPIGPVYAAPEADRLARERGWRMTGDAHGRRRVVPSPVPRRILELESIRKLLDLGHIVICAGGGGIPVVVESEGSLRGVEAVVDKDRTAALLAEGVGADALLLLTDVPGVYEEYGTPRQRQLRIVGTDAWRALALDRGSMGPKLEAACRFVERTGRLAAIGALEDAWKVLSEESGTVVARNSVAVAVP
jgi:carbamate kinase